MDDYKHRQRDEMGSEWSQENNSDHHPPSKLSQSDSHNSVQKTPELKPRDILYETKATFVEKPNPPHNYKTILKDADSPINHSSEERFYDQLYSGVILNQKRKKYWVEKNSDKNCFMLFARDLSITWADNNRYWNWLYLKETTSEMFIDVAELQSVCWLEIHGKIEMTKLSPSTLYEIVFVVMLKDSAYGWEFPVNLRLTLPDGSKREKKESLVAKPRNKWVELTVGEFKTSSENIGNIEISLYDYDGGTWKKGLLIKGVIIRPKTQNSK